MDEGQLDPRFERAVATACHHHFVTPAAEAGDQFEEMSLATTDILRRTNLQNAHCGIQNLRAILRTSPWLFQLCRPQFPRHGWRGWQLLPCWRPRLGRGRGYR